MMNKTIKTILVSGFFLCTIPVMAQEEFPDMQPPFPQQEEGKAPFKEIPNPEKSAKRITEEMAKELNLTEKQYKKVYKLILKEQKSLIENRMGQMRPPMMPGNPGEGEMPMMGQPGERPPMGMGSEGMSHPKPPRMDEDMAKELEKARQKKEKKLKKILTDEQYTRWQEIQLKRKNEPGKPPVPPEEK